MTDIFFSYSSKDRERVRPIHAALTAQGFDIFWDQSVPPGTDWDTWIRQHLNAAKCAIVFWSQHSVVSDNVRHEATIAKQQGKLFPALLDTLATDQFPMGFYTTQAANLTAWNGDEQHEGWLQLEHQVQSKLTPLWVRRQIDRVEAELVAEQARRESAERRDRILRDQIAKEASAQQELRRERDEVLDNLAALKARLESAERDKTAPDTRLEALSLRVSELESERHRLVQELEAERSKAGALERAVSELRAAREQALTEIAALKSRAGTGDVGTETAAAATIGVGNANEVSATAAAAPPTQATLPTADRRAIGLAVAFVLAVPFLLLFGESGLLAAALAIGAYTFFRVCRRAASITGVEIALYWFGCAFAVTVALAAFFYARTGDIRTGTLPGLLIGCLGTLVSALWLAGRRKTPLSGAEIAIYWLGCSLAVAGAIFMLSASYDWSWLGPYAEGPTPPLVSAVTMMAAVAFIACWRRARLERLEFALYWFACSVAIGVALPVIFYTFGRENKHISLGLAFAALSTLVSGAILIRHSMVLEDAEAAIYGLGASLAVALLFGPILGVLSTSVIGWFAGVAAFVATGVAIYIWYRRQHFEHVAKHPGLRA